jgi:hypothetical protein
MKTKFSVCYWIIIMCLIVGNYSLYAQTYKAAAGSGGGNPTSPNVIGIYVYSGTLPPAGKPYYTKISGNSNSSYCFYINSFWDISETLGDDGPTKLYYYNVALVASNGNTFPYGDYGLTWSADYGQVSTTNAPITSQNLTADMTLTDGSGYTPSSGTPGANNNIIGRFKLLGNHEGGVLQSVTISLSGTRSGVSNVKLWSSSDNSFNSGSDTQLSSKSDATSVTFNGFNSLVDNTSGTYYFITMDLTGGATGSVTATIPSQTSFSFAGANQPSSFSNASLSSSAVPLPVELISFTAMSSQNLVNLKWATATEINNYGFNVERAVNLQGLANGKEGSNLGGFTSIGFVKGNGNSNSPKEYSFTDKPTGGNAFQYRLKQIDLDGAFKYSDVVDATIQTVNAAKLEQNYPNPFNPATKIQFTVPEAETNTKSYLTQLKVYDALGRVAATLVEENKTPGNYEVTFNASELSSGIYFYKLIVDGKMYVKKMILTK